MSGFWDRRRAAVAAEAEVEAQAAEEAALQAQEAALAERDDDALLAELELPAPEDLVGGEQLRAFLKAQLPQRLKTRALRSFWRSNPVLACLDGLNDYEDDYTAAATAGKAVNTLYQVGKGMVSPVAEVLEQIVTDASPEMAVQEAPVRDVVPPLPRAVPVEQVAIEPVEMDDEAEDIATPPNYRRMRFEFAADVANIGESTGA